MPSRGSALSAVLVLLAGAGACVHELDDACGAEPGKCVSGEETDVPAPTEEGARALVAGLAALPFVSVSDDGRYPDGFLLQVRAPAGTAYVVYSSEERVLGVGDEATSLFAVRATFGSFGAQGIVARAFNGAHDQIAEGAVTVWVDPPSEAAGIEFVSPAQEGGSYANGIWFKVSTSGPVWSVRYSADGWALGESMDLSSSFAVRYTFSLVGQRRVRAEALSQSGAVLAAVERTIIVVDPDAPTPSTRAGRAMSLLVEHEAGRVVFWNEQFGGRQDGADAYGNIRDTANGGGALRSVHGTAPGGSVNLSTALLDGMLALKARGFRFFVTSIAGGSHSAGSLHYQGRAFDLDEINGVRVYGDSAAARSIMDACRQLGAIEVFGPSNDPYGHYDHIHCAW